MGIGYMVCFEPTCGQMRKEHELHLYERKHGIKQKGLALTVILFAVTLLVFAVLFSEAKVRQSANSGEQLASAIRQAAVTCYAIEGRYPESLAYIMDNYGVVIEYDQFVVQYDVFAENVMPVIRVLEIGGAS